MLLLTRTIGETIIIDGGIEITVSDIQGNHIKLAIDAPKEVKVYREEIYKRVQAETDSGKDAA
jgi:carbon storage regulator